MLKKSGVWHFIKSQWNICIGVGILLWLFIQMNICAHGKVLTSEWHAYQMDLLQAIQSDQALADYWREHELAAPAMMRSGRRTHVEIWLIFPQRIDENHCGEAMRIIGEIVGAQPAPGKGDVEVIFRSYNDDRTRETFYSRPLTPSVTAGRSVE